MSYTTILYAVDLEGLRAAIGSNDGALVDRIQGEILDEGSSKTKKGKLVRVEVDASGSIYLDGKEVHFEQVKQAMQTLTGPGDRIRVHIANPDGFPDIQPAIVQTMLQMHESVGRAPAYESSPKDYLWVDDDDEDDDEDGSNDADDGVRRLIFGENAGPDTASEDAYALEHLCRFFGSELDTDDALAGLDDLQIESPLCKWRMPGDLPQPDNFPFISYLIPQEVAAEVARLQSIDLSFPNDDDIEYAREVLLGCLVDADEKGQAVVAFYY